jgi:hypothetical protein
LDKTEGPFLQKSGAADLGHRFNDGWLKMIGVYVYSHGISGFVFVKEKGHKTYT